MHISINHSQGPTAKHSIYFDFSSVIILEVNSWGEK